MFFPGWEFLEFTTEGLKLDPWRIENNLKERSHAFDPVVTTGGDPSFRFIPPTWPLERWHGCSSRGFCRQWIDIPDYSLAHSSSFSESRCRAEFYRVDLDFGPCNLVEPFYPIVLGHADFFSRRTAKSYVWLTLSGRRGSDFSGCDKEN